MGENIYGAVSGVWLYFKGVEKKGNKRFSQTQPIYTRNQGSLSQTRLAKADTEMELKVKNVHERIIGPKLYFLIPKFRTSSTNPQYLRV